MADGRKNNGSQKGGNPGAGRPAKAEEQQLIEKLTPLSEPAYKALTNALKDEQGWAVKLFFEYMYGKPKQSTDITTNGKEINITPIEWV
jgi:transposase